MSSRINRNIAIRRLRRDLIELQRADIPTISAQPLDYNIFEWHVNIKPSDGVYSGVYFHLIMIFPETYPKDPPKVQVCTAISHPNIFGQTLCLSMLRPHTSTSAYEGWSGAYSVTSILMQLQSFVFAKKVVQDNGREQYVQFNKRNVEYSVTRCKKFKCGICEHRHDNPWPKLKGSEQDNDHKAIEDKEHNVDWHDHHIIDELWVWIFEALEVDDIFSSYFVCKRWRKLLANFNCIERNELICYYTKAKLGQEKGGKILGIGLNIKAREYGGYEFNSQMDILSLDAWSNGCKTGVWGESLTHFLPLVMNKKHAEIADEAIHEYLEKIKVTLDSSDKGYSNRDPNEFDVIVESNKNLQLIDTLITMMNQIVVQFVMRHKNTDVRYVSMIMCEKAVLGYCALHHLLLYLKKKYGADVRNFANRKVWYFINKEDGRNKTNCKDLGKFLIYLMISTQYTWNDICSIFVEEVFTRNVRWMVQDEKYKIYDTTNPVKGRVKASFKASKISRRLVMFQVWFMKNVASETLQTYNKRLGRPRMRIKNTIVGKTKYILQSTSWEDYFKELGVKVAGGYKGIAQLLRFAIYNSKKNRYHKSYGYRPVIEQVDVPEITTSDPNYKGPKKNLKEPPSFAIKLPEKKENKPYKSNKSNNNLRVSLSGWRGRARGGTTRYHNAGRGRGFRPRGPPQNNRYPQQSQPVRQPGQSSMRGRGFTPRHPSQHNQYQQQRAPRQNIIQSPSHDIQNRGETELVMRERGVIPRNPQNNQPQQQNERVPPSRNQNQNQNVVRGIGQQLRQSSMRGRGFSSKAPPQQTQSRQPPAQKPTKSLRRRRKEEIRNRNNDNGSSQDQSGQASKHNLNDVKSNGRPSPNVYQRGIPNRGQPSPLKKPVQFRMLTRQHQSTLYQHNTPQQNQNPQHRVTPQIYNQYPQQRVTPKLPNQMNDNVNSALNPEQTIRTQNTVPLCEYHQTPGGCALGRLCNYRH